jgi:hypothetical protein
MVPFLLFAAFLGVAFLVLWFLIPKTPRKPRVSVAVDDPHASRLRYDRARTWPWLVVTLAGTMALLHSAKVCAATADAIVQSPLNAPSGGFGLSLLIAICALAARSARRWPALVIMGALASHMFLAFHSPAPEAGSHSDELALWMLLVMFFTSGYACLRPMIRKPPEQTTGSAASNVCERS